MYLLRRSSESFVGSVSVAWSVGVGVTPSCGDILYRRRDIIHYRSTMIEHCDCKVAEWCADYSVKILVVGMDKVFSAVAETGSIVIQCWLCR